MNNFLLALFLIIQLATIALAFNMPVDVTFVIDLAVKGLIEKIG